MLRDPASAVAASKCLLSRLFPHRLFEGLRGIAHAAHPEPCLWEDYSLPDLLKLVEDFNEWADFNRQSGVYRNVTVRSFQALPPVEQSRRVQLAQYGEGAVGAPDDDPWETVG